MTMLADTIGGGGGVVGGEWTETIRKYKGKKGKAMPVTGRGGP
jgi:hypothetical protein